MVPIPRDINMVVFNAALGLPNTTELITTATRAEADVIVCLQFATERLDAEAVRAWVVRSSEQLRASDVHLVSFNPDLGLVLGRPLDLTAGLHSVAPHLWLIVRLWFPPMQSSRATVTFVGPTAIRQDALSGSFWGDELLKPEDLAAVRPSEVVVADLESELITPAHGMPGLHSPSTLHPFLGRAVVQRASARAVWAAAPEGAPCSPGRVRPGEHAVVRLGQRV